MPTPRSTKLRTVLATAAVMAFGSLAAAPSSSAHDPGFYKWWYPIGIDDVPVRFDNDFPNGRSRLRMTDGAKEWNDLGRRMYFRVDRSPSINGGGGDIYNFRKTAHCPTPEVGGRRVGVIHWSPIDAKQGIVGATSWCWKGDAGSKSLKSFRIHMDRDEDWYTRRGDSSVKNRRTGARKNFLDMWSVATHELGHATGWVPHWKGGNGTCDINGKPEGKFRTMCPVVRYGYERARTLSNADKHVFRSHYGAR